MKDTILLVGHGSRAVEGNDEILQFAEQWRARQPGWRIEVCFIEFAEVLLSAGLNRAAEGSDRVLVVPLILNAAGHVRVDVPLAIKAAQKRHPGVSFLYAPHLGAGEPFLRILKRNLRQAMLSLDVPDPESTGVILLGRGSSDRLANGEVAKMARWLWELGDHQLVDIAFTGITFPRLEKAVQRQVMLGMTQIIVLPYYLFTGTLIQRIERQMGHLARQYPQVRFAHAPYLGFEPEVFELVTQRVRDMQQGTPGSVVDLDLLMMPDPFKAEAGHHHHHHHHEHDHGHHHDGGHGHDHAHHHGHHHHHEHDDCGHHHGHNHDHAHGHDHGHGDHHDHDHGRCHAHHATGEHLQHGSAHHRACHAPHHGHAHQHAGHEHEQVHGHAHGHGHGHGQDGHAHRHHEQAQGHPQLHKGCDHSRD